jgi:hypothetical protein
MKYHYLEIPRLGSIYAERCIHAKWLKVEHEFHLGEVELLWGKWRFVLTSWHRLKKEREQDYEPDFEQLSVSSRRSEEALPGDACCTPFDTATCRGNRGGSHIQGDNGYNRPVKFERIA